MRTRYDVDKLLNPQFKETFQKRLVRNYRKYTYKHNISTSYKEIEIILKTTAGKLLVKVSMKKQSWIMNELLSLCNERRLNQYKKYQQKMLKNINSRLRKSMIYTK